MAFFFSVDWAFIQDVIPAKEAGLFMGFSNIATAGSGIIARFVGGFLLDPFNHGPQILGLPGAFRSSSPYSAHPCWSARY